MKKILVLLFLASQVSTAQLAFPNAEGFGRNATGGRGGTIIHVTNRNDSGSGSLREALSTTGTRTIVFDVGGDWDLQSELRIGTTNSGTNLSYSNVTIAGETAPSPGVNLLNYGISVYAENVIISYVTIGLGNENTDNGGTEADALRVRNWGTNGALSDFFFTNLHLRWSSDENFSLQSQSATNTINNVTLQNSILSEPTNYSGYGMLLHDNIRTTSIIGNYFAFNRERNPLIGRGTEEEIEVINNVFYGYQYGAVITYNSYVDFIGNIYKNIPADKADGYSMDSSNNSFTELQPEDGELYVADNFQVGAADYALYGPRVTARAQASRSLTTSNVTTWASTVAEIEARVLNDNVGNSLYRDATADRVLADYTNGTGAIFNSTDPSTLSTGWDYKTGTTKTAGFDSDNDGMDDVYEIEIWGDITTTNSPWAYTDGTLVSDFDSWTNHEKTRFVKLDVTTTIPVPEVPVISTPKASNVMFINN